MAASTLAHERRKAPRLAAPKRLGVQLLAAQRALPVNSLNVSADGLCVRIESMLEVRSVVRLQLTRGKPKPVECTGRVAWVIQRLDLRTAPPFLFDVGIELVNPPTAVRQLLGSTAGGRWAAQRARASLVRALEPATIKGRHYVPKLMDEAAHAPRWHLVVSVDGTPCLSSRFASERAARAAWEGFKRRQAKR